MNESIFSRSVQDMQSEGGPSIPMEIVYKSRAALQAERGKATKPKYNRAFARKKWREDFANGTFMFRKANLPSSPRFYKFKKLYVEPRKTNGKNTIHTDA